MAKIELVKEFIILELPEDADSKIYVPDTIDKKKVIAGTSLIVNQIGPDCQMVKIGDRLLTDPNAVVSFALDGKELFLTSEKNVCAIIRSE